MQPQSKQAPTPKPKPKQKPAQPAKPAEGQPAQTQVTPQDQQLPIVYSPWSKYCGTDASQRDAKEACLTIREARLNTGQLVAGAALIEQKGEQKKILRITLPLGMQLKAGTRVLIDQAQAMQEHYVVCFPNGCMSDFEVGPDFVSTIRNSQTLLLQGINLQGQVVSFPLPLSGFAEANDGPPVDPKQPPHR